MSARSFLLVFSLFWVLSSSLYSRMRVSRKSMIIKSHVESISVKVQNVEASVALLTNGLGMDASKLGDKVVVRSVDVKAPRFVIESRNSPQNLVVSDDKTTAFQGIGIVVNNAKEVFEKCKKMASSTSLSFDDHSYGASSTPDEDELKTWPVSYGKLIDTNGVEFEVSDVSTYSQPKLKVVLNVLDLEESIEFYTKQLGMTLSRKRSNVNNRPRQASLSAFLTYPENSDQFGVELVYNYASEKLDDSLRAQINISSDTFEDLSRKVTFIKKTDDVITLEDPNGNQIHIHRSA